MDIAHQRASAHQADKFGLLGIIQKLPRDGGQFGRLDVQPQAQPFALAAGHFQAGLVASAQRFGKQRMCGPGHAPSIAPLDGDIIGPGGMRISNRFEQHCRLALIGTVCTDTKKCAQAVEQPAHAGGPYAGDVITQKVKNRFPLLFRNRGEELDNSLAE